MRPGAYQTGLLACISALCVLVVPTVSDLDAAASAEASVLRAAIQRQKNLILNGPQVASIVKATPEEIALHAAQDALRAAEGATQTEHVETEADYDALKNAVYALREQLQVAQKAAVKARQAMHKEREQQRLVAVRTLHTLTEQLEEQAVRRAEAAAAAAIEAGTEHAFGELDVEEPTGGASVPHVATVIWLHGLGEHGADWRRQFRPMGGFSPVAELPGVRWLFPTANRRLLLNYGGEAHRAWFRPNGTRPASHEDPEGLERSVTAVLALAHAHARETGLPLSRILLGGFDQGAAVALCAVLQAAVDAKLSLAVQEGGVDDDELGLFGGLVMHGGWVPLNLPKGLNMGLLSAAMTTPTLMLHGALDKLVSLADTNAGADRLRALGLSDLILNTDYACGHSINGPMQLDIVIFVRTVFELGSRDEELPPPPPLIVQQPTVNEYINKHILRARAHEL
jgi:predicted esterase